GDRDVVAGVITDIEAKPDVARPSGEVDDVVQVGIPAAERHFALRTQVAGLQTPVPVLDICVDKPVADVAAMGADRDGRLARLNLETIALDRLFGRDTLEFALDPDLFRLDTEELVHHVGDGPAVVMVHHHRAGIRRLEFGWVAVEADHLDDVRRVVERPSDVGRFDKLDLVDFGEQSCQRHAQAFGEEAGMDAGAMQRCLAGATGFDEPLLVVGAANARKVVRFSRDDVLAALEQGDDVRIDLLAVHRTRGEQDHVGFQSQYFIAIGRGLHAGGRKTDQLAGISTRLRLAVDLDSNQVELGTADDLAQGSSANMAGTPNDYAVRPAHTRL